MFTVFRDTFRTRAFLDIPLEILTQGRREHESLHVILDPFFRVLCLCLCLGGKPIKVRFNLIISTDLQS